MHTRPESLPWRLRRPTESAAGRRRVRRIVLDRLFSGEAGTRVGRYRLLEEIGRGGMGTVWAAVDEELHRPAALKLLHEDVGLPRFVREAQALAAVSHPNIVAIYDVGREDGESYIAMERVTGQTLSSWLKTPRRWREVLAAMLQAARGIRAAHEAGLVHRDFKPSNAMIGPDGRVQVLDFGLVAVDADPPDEITDLPRALSQEGQRWGRSDSLTVTGAVVGTLAYMSPEQIAGGAAGRPADQFAFCATFYQALHGTRPFRGTTPAELFDAVATGSKPGRLNCRVPRWLHQTIVRGLSLYPQDRWPSMDALIAKLEHPRRRSRICVGGGLLLGMTGTAIAVGGQPEDGRCSDGAERIVGVWNASTIREVASALEATPDGAGTAAWSRMEPRLSAYAIRWRAAWARGCASRGLPSQDSEADATTACLAQRLRQFEATLEQLARGGAAAVTHGEEAVARLGPPSRCFASRPEARHATKGSLARSDALRSQLARAEVMANFDRTAAASTVVEAVAAAAHEHGLGRVGAEAGLLRGQILLGTERYSEADAVLQQAYWLALQSQHDEAALRLALMLARSATTTDRFDAAESWLRHARATMLRLPPDDARKARLLQRQGALAFELRQEARALGLWQEALEHAELAFSEPHPLVAMLASDVAAAMLQTGDAQGALPLLARARSIDTALYGARHFSIAQINHTLAGAELDLGHTATARALFVSVYDAAATGRLARTIRADAATSLGILEFSSADKEQALAYTREGLALYRSLYGEDNMRVAEVSADLSRMLAQMQRFEEAQTHSIAAISIAERVAGHGDPQTATMLRHRARVLRLEGRDADAVPLLQRALAIFEKAEHLEGAPLRTLLLLGETHLSMKQPQKAQLFFERASETATRSHAALYLHARARFGLAKTSASTGHPQIARQHGEAALRLYEQASPRPEAADVRRWVDQLPD